MKNVTDLMDEIAHLKSENVRLKQQLAHAIAWSVEDFESVAYDIELVESDHAEATPLYDRSKFPDALRTMIRKHDANFGITWDTVEFWLNELCRITPTTPLKEIN